MLNESDKVELKNVQTQPVAAPAMAVAPVTEQPKVNMSAYQHMMAALRSESEP